MDEEEGEEGEEEEGDEDEWSWAEWFMAGRLDETAAGLWARFEG